MGIEHKHAYRFVFLRSEEWKDVRYEALAREQMRCQICNEENFSNDAHHVYYPKNIWDTEAGDVVILCRDCHEMVQALFYQQKDRKAGLVKFNNIVAVIQKWFSSKSITSKACLISPLNIRRTKVPIVAGEDTGCCLRCGVFNEKCAVVDLFEIKGYKSENKCGKFLCPDCIKNWIDEVFVPAKGFDQRKIKNNSYRCVRLWMQMNPIGKVNFLQPKPSPA